MQDIRREFLSFKDLVIFGLDIVKEYWKVLLGIVFSLLLVDMITTFMLTSLLGHTDGELLEAMRMYSEYGKITMSTGEILFTVFLVLVDCFISFLAILATVYLVKCFFENREFSFYEMFSFVGTKIKGYLLTALYLVFIVIGIIILASIIFGIFIALSEYNLIVAILGFFGFSAFWIVFELKYIFIFHAVGFFNKSGKEAFKLSANLTKGYKFKIFARQFCLSIVYFIVLIVLAFVPFIGAIVSPFLSLFSYIFLAVMFLNLFYLSRVEEENEKNDFEEEYSN